MRLVLLHGLARRATSMRPLERALREAGHDTLAVDYPSRHRRLVDLGKHLASRLDEEGIGASEEVGFVCHSMGGILLRQLATLRPEFKCGRSVVIGSPINGSILAEKLAELTPVKWLYGPVLPDLSAANVATLSQPPGPFGTIAGTKWSPLLPGAFFIKTWAKGEPSDGTVLLRETRSESAVDHIEVNRVHSFLPFDKTVLAQVNAFLMHGAFDRT